MVWPWLSPDAEEGLVAARGLVALLVKVVIGVNVVALLLAAAMLVPMFVLAL